MSLRNDHEYTGEPYEYRRLRLRDRADTATTLDLPGDRAAEYAPVPWWAMDPSFKTAPSRVPSLAGSCRTDAAPVDPHPEGAADTSVAGGLGGYRPPAAHPSLDLKDAA